MNFKLIYLFSIVAILFVSTSLRAEEKIRIGTIARVSKKSIKRFSPLVSYLKSKGFNMGKIRNYRTFNRLLEKFKAGNVELFFESPYQALKMIDQGKAIPLLIREKSGDKYYQSAIFTKKDSPINNFEDLLGKVIGFEDPGSTSSYKVPSVILRTKGYELVESSTPVEGKIAYVFTNQDDNTIIQVKKGRIVAGGMKMKKIKKKKDLKVIGTPSEPVPRQVVLVHPKVSKKLQERLKKALLNMKNDPNAKAALKSIKTKTGFSEFDEDPIPYMTQKVRRILEGN